MCACHAAPVLPDAGRARLGCAAAPPASRPGAGADRRDRPWKNVAPRFAHASRFAASFVSASIISAPASSSALRLSAPVAITSSPSCCTLRLLRSRALSPSAFSSASKSRGLRIVVFLNVDGEMIVEAPAECRKIIGTAWDAVVPPENFSYTSFRRALWRATDLIAMAIYHLHVKVIGRKSGSSAVASAAYRSGSRLRDERLDRSHDFSAKRGVVHSEVLLPENAP